MPGHAPDPPDRNAPASIEELRRENERLREDLRRSEAERQRLRRENERLKEELDAARRAVYRQAAPFSRGVPTRAARRPGRKAGAAYGRCAYRRRPARIDEIYDVPLPARCPHCAGPVRRTRIAAQFHEDLPVQRPIVRHFRVHVGACRHCRRRVQGRHPLQTSDALGAAAVQLGPQAVALAVLLNKQLGLSYGKITQLLRDRFGLRVTRGGVTHAVHRAARHAQPSYAALCATVRGSPVVTADETSWRVAADLQWLWAFVTPETTVYAIQPGRGLAQAAPRDRPRLCRRPAARRLAVVPAFQPRAASDLSRASAAPLSRPPARLSRRSCVPQVKACCRRHSPRAIAIAPAPSRRTVSPSRAGTISSVLAGCSSDAQSSPRRSDGSNSI